MRRSWGRESFARVRRAHRCQRARGPARAGWDGMGWLWCSGDEQNELFGGRGSRWRPSGVERCGDFIGAGEGTNDPHGAVAALANREVDAEDAGEQTHPRQPMPGGIEQVPLERGAGVGGKLEVSLGDNDGELLGLGVHGVRGRDDSSAQGVPSACRRPRRASVLRHRSGGAPTTKPGWARPSPAGHRPRRPPRAVRFRQAHARRGRRAEAAATAEGAPRPAARWAGSTPPACRHREPRSSRRSSVRASRPARERPANARARGPRRRSPAYFGEHISPERDTRAPTGSMPETGASGANVHGVLALCVVTTAAHPRAAPGPSAGHARGKLRRSRNSVPGPVLRRSRPALEADLRSPAPQPRRRTRNSTNRGQHHSTEPQLRLRSCPSRP